VDATLSDLRDRIEAASSVLVASHDRPDGDAIGSSVALGLILEKLGKQVAVVNRDPVPETLAFLPGSERVLAPAGRSGADLLVVLDSAGRDRIGEAVWEMAADVPFTINIDHHVSNTGFGDLAHVDPVAPATGQLVHRLAAFAGWPLDAAIGENLLAAISTDTGSFRYASTTAETMRIAGDILELGVDVGRVNRLLYESYPRRRVEALRQLLQGMRLDFGERCASVKLPLATTHALGLRVGDTEGVIDVIRAIDSVCVAVFFEELPDGKIRVSSRSKDERCGVGEICAAFGGGGHTLAAGARLPGPLGAAEDRFLTAVGEALARVPPLP
jgi:phosphoesterase RecJ-like protein